MAFQELNQYEIIRELVKKSKKINQLNEIENNIYEAIDLARSVDLGLFICLYHLIS